MTAVPADDTVPLHISDTIVRGAVTPTYPVIAYPHSASGGDAIAGGIVYRGRKVPELAGRLVFADITTGRVWYADIAEVRAAVSGRGRVDMRLAEDAAGELYVLTKSDGMIRQVVGLR